MSETNDLQRIVGWIKSELKLGPKELAERRNQPSGQEVGLKHPWTGGQVLLRDDTTVEVTAGPATSVMVDGAHGMVDVRAPAIALEATYHHVHAQDSYWGFQRWDPLHWWRAPVPGDMASWLWNGPLVANNPAALGTLLALPVVCGEAHTPDPDDTPFQYVTTLGSLLHAQPLLGPDETFLHLATHLAQLMKTLAIGR
jgi:hypothetical protein